MQTDAQWPFPEMPPREVQTAALAAGWGKPGYAYFMRQRLGKTLVAYAEYTLLREAGAVDWMIIICPNSIKRQWQEQIEEVDITTPIHIYTSQKKKQFEEWADACKNTGGVLIINYESIKSFINAGYWQKIDTIRTYIVADECTEIKTPFAKSTKACLELASICTIKRILSGKPTANSNADLWSPLRFINATEDNFYQFQYRYTMLGGYKGKQFKQNINVEELKQKMKPYVYIPEQKYIEGKFERIYEPPRFVELTGKQREMYDEMENSLITEIVGGVKITAPIVLSKYLRLQQISSGIAGTEDGQQLNIIKPEDNPKIKVLLEILENETSNKVIIVCRFTKSIDNIHRVLSDKGYKIAIMVGSMGERLEEQKKLFTESDYDILLAQIQVLNYGHKLCGPIDNPCLDMIFFENNWSLLDRGQCEARPEDMDRTKATSYWDMYASQMDRIIVDALIKKEDAAMALLGYSRSLGMMPACDNGVLQPGAMGAPSWMK